MQKEAIVVSSAGGAWRLSSDDGAYLNGFDEAPCPLAFMTTGMAASFMDAIQTRLREARIDHDGVRLVQDNSDTMRGSMPRRTMIGGAEPGELDVLLYGNGHLPFERPSWFRQALRLQVEHRIQPASDATAFALSHVF